LLLGTAEVLRDNCGQTFMPSIVEVDQLEKANGRMWSVENIANTFIGPPLGSLLLIVAFSLPFFVDAASFFAAAALVAAIPGTYRAERPDDHVQAPWRSELAEGFRWLWANDLLRSMAIILGLMNLASMLSGSVLVLFAQEILNVGPFVFTIMGFGLAAGAAVGGNLAPWMSKRLGSGTCLAMTLGSSAATAFVYRNAASSFEGATGAAVLALQLPTGATWTLTASRQDDDLLLPFVPIPGTSVPAGRHSAVFAQLGMTPPGGPPLVVGGSVRAGDYYDGSLYSLVLSPEWRASSHLRLAGEVQIDRLDFPVRGERAWSKLARLKVLASASPRLSFSAVLQASSVAERATGNLRLRYNPREGHDLWIVYGHQMNLDRDRTTPRAPGTAQAGLLVKYARSFGS